MVAAFPGAKVPAMVDVPATSKEKAPVIVPITPEETIKSPSIPELAVKVNVLVPAFVKLK